MHVKRNLAGRKRVRTASLTVRARSLFLLTTLALTVPGLSGCQALGDHSVQWISEGSGTSFGLAVPLPDVARPMTVLAGGLCRNGTSLPIITDVSFVHADAAMKVTDWATRTRGANATTSGADVGQLSENGYSPQSKSVEAACSTLGTNSTDLAIQVEVSAAGRFTNSDLLVQYSANSANGSVQIPITLVLCVGYPKGAICKGE